MGFFLWGVMFGWGLCSLFWYNHSNEDDKTAGSATIIFIGLLIMAGILSINLGIASGSIPIEGISTPTPQLGR